LETVLVLEDEPLAMRMICATLRLNGYELAEATTPTAAIQMACERRPFDLLIADVTLPERSGVRTALDLYAASPEIAILFVSGTPFEGWQPRDLLTVQILPREVWEFLRKPFRASALKLHVRQLLDRSAAARSVQSTRAPAAASESVTDPTMERLLRVAGSGNDVMTVPNPLENWGSNESRSIPRRIPDVVFCPEKVSLTEEFLSAIQELTELQAQQTRAVIEDDPDFSRFDVLIHMANERKEQAKYALIRHMEAHHCEERWNRWH